MDLLKTIFCLSFLPLLSSCSSKNSSSCETLAERIFSQKGCPVLLHPPQEKRSPPCYPWHPYPNPVLTRYAFLCQGREACIETPEGILYDCNGFNHSLKEERFKTIHPKLIELSRKLQQSYPRLSIVEGLCCQKHFRFLQASKKSPSEKHLSGHAALITIPEELSLEDLCKALKAKHPIRDLRDPSILEISEARLSLYREGDTSSLLIEILDS
ncbi:hypothetical protein [Chlamydia pecorum]|uniref:Lipoprotein, putative n=1 Tax=Chlamydia pecorum (strain ATCC VR-628 / DSM 29919 / E58) TaxID=331635 RepID=A0AA34RD15_CHLPE|nr:hypothetical protein [Chlamydia pecorum]AEB41461.1 lipoprotein, putative [Chlamydia pecorum E58]